MSGYQATDLQIPLTLPERSVKRIASLQGKLRALVPGREETFEFEQLDKAKARFEELKESVGFKTAA